MKDIGTALKNIAKKKTRTVIGLMSGTSADAIDVAVCRITGGGLAQGRKPRAHVELIHFEHVPYSKATSRQIHKAKQLTVREIAELNYSIGKEFGRAVLKIPARIRQKVDLIGSHGQTIYHHSGSSTSAGAACTFQLGEADVIAHLTGLPVVADFRAADIAAGGEGAPLTPYADLVFFGAEAGKAVLNLGGIANVTILSSKATAVIGFDTGPANAPLDRLARIITGGKLGYDRGASIAKAGTVMGNLLQGLIKDDPYLKRMPPKSTGIEAYGDKFVLDLIKRQGWGKANADTMATALEFVVQSIVLSLRKHAPRIKELILCGGGSQNPLIVKRLRQCLSGITISTTDKYGIPTYAREAMAFALFANDAVLGLKTNLPSVTGARKAVTLGKITLS